MPGITDWREALINPCFWVNRYYEVDPSVAAELFGVSFQERQSYYLKHLLGCEDDLEQADEELDRREGSALVIPFPEGYTWTTHFTHEAFVHTISHPQVYPGGARIAVESGHGSLPGLRWSELKQMVTCLQQWGYGAFDVRAVFPLLHPVVWLVTLDELDDVRQTLHAAWDALQVLKPPRLARWIDETIVVYDKGQLLYYDSVLGRHAPFEWMGPSTEKPLWTYDPLRGWHIDHGLRQDSSKFAGFFALLERYAPVQE
jgi:hypothetical protein